MPEKVNAKRCFWLENRLSKNPLLYGNLSKAEDLSVAFGYERPLYFETILSVGDSANGGSVSEM